MGFHSLDALHDEMGRLLGGDEARAVNAGTLPQAGQQQPVAGGALILFTYPLLVDEGRLSVGADELKEGLEQQAFVEVHPDDAARLGIADGSTVADIGAGAGWFTIQLARRVGPNGVVYAEDVQRQMLEAIRRRVSREGLQNVQARLGTETDPNLPARALDAILVVDVYPEVDDRVTFLHNLSAALKPNGRIGVVNYKPGQGGPGPSSTANEGIRVDSSAVEADARAAGLRVLGRENLPFQYLIVLGK